MRQFPVCAPPKVKNSAITNSKHLTTLVERLRYRAEKQPDKVAYTFLDDGELFVTGRLKDLIIIHGQNHYPQDIELTVERAIGFVKANGCAVASITVDGAERLVMAVEASRELIRKIKAVRKQQAPSPNVHSDQSAKVRDELDRMVGSIATQAREAVARAHEISLYALAFVKAGGCESRRGIGWGRAGRVAAR
uniref:Uncharacterized protein n=1 Tax=Candidatus Kentrum sp. TUN TaxID=2126343 RepID=A0A450ZF14_9GAMM|nr:MAG: hypothetical protein BECKTUN1418F_GA0071002_10088 [Candidatus Kentron sp. TUN]VFK52908.1 MAG: hypothetical protein BECKTUN1418E_GA0071001_10118 [Candidatus Kentron sp. TUN]VFK63772.1 MAG: hypothetical protein BECKTUN1418D_GA0071000_12254 [Candidatus Kentron sp. TUN]